MNPDLMTAALLLNPLLTFEEVEREVAMLRAAAKSAASECDSRWPAEADRTRTVRRPRSLALRPVS